MPQHQAHRALRAGYARRSPGRGFRARRRALVAGLDAEGAFARLRDAQRHRQRSLLAVLVRDDELDRLPAVVEQVLPPGRRRIGPNSRIECVRPSIEMSVSPATRPAFSAGDPATTAVMVGCTTGLKTQATTKSSRTAVSTFIATPATRTVSCLASDAFVKARGRRVLFFALEAHEAADGQPVQGVFRLVVVAQHLGLRREAKSELQNANPNQAGDQEVAELVDQTSGTRITSRSGTARTQNSSPSRLIVRLRETGARRRRSRRADPVWVRRLSLTEPLDGAASSRGIPLKSSVPPRNRATATSSAEIRAVLARDRNTGFAGNPQGRKRSSSGARNSRRPAAIRSTATAGEGKRSG